MKASNVTLAALLAASLTLGAASSVFAFGSHGRDCDMGARQTSPMRVLYQLDSLSDEQRSEIKKLMKEERSSLRDLMDAMQDNRDAMQDAMKDNLSAEKIKPLAEKQGELITEMTMARARIRDKINTLLTDEQRDELSKMKPQKRRDNDDRNRGDYSGW